MSYVVVGIGSFLAGALVAVLVMLGDVIWALGKPGLEGLLKRK